MVLIGYEVLLFASGHESEAIKSVIFCCQFFNQLFDQYALVA